MSIHIHTFLFHFPIDPTKTTIFFDPKKKKINILFKKIACSTFFELGAVIESNVKM